LLKRGPISSKSTFTSACSPNILKASLFAASVLRLACEMSLSANGLAALALDNEVLMLWCISKFFARLSNVAWRQLVKRFKKPLDFLCLILLSLL
jgi:hypothetical protein